MRLITALSVSAIAFAVAISATPASAAIITQFSYTVSGGSFGAFGGTNATGAITGGSVNVTMPGTSGIPTTPSWSCSSASGGCGTAAIVLTGLSGYIKATGLPVSWVWVSAGHASFAHFGALTHAMLSGTAPPGVAATLTNWHVSAGGGSGSGGINQTWIQTGPYAWKGYPVHSFQIGQEVRTPIPEPTTATLLGLGLALLGAAGSSAGLAARARRRSRE